METGTSSRLSPGLVALMAMATGVAVASNYYAQPLLHTIAGQFGISNGAAGSMLFTFLYERGGWLAVSASGAVLSALGLAIWRGSLRRSAATEALNPG